MELSRIIIKNFRSIKDADIKFEHNCLILLGKNEAGKSNVLRAIASLFKKYTVSNKDKRKKIDNEKIEEYFVRGVFRLSDKDIFEVVKRFNAKYTNTENITFKNNKKLEDYINTRFREFLIQIDIKESTTQNYNYWKYEKEDFDLINKLYLTGNSITTEASGKTELNLIKEIFDIIKVLYSENPYQCHYWQYKESYLLPNSVVIDNFISTPSSCQSLENIFALCHRDNIKQEFTDAMSQDGDYANLLDQISRTVTNTFRKIWKDFKETSIQLQPNGGEILIKVVNKAKYSFEDRSDGFKKFISILLMLSTQARTNRIRENDLILIDEPDQSLYPTSAQYLRDELLEIAKKSKIIYSTHSQYMIDSTCLERHIIVEKEDDITKLKKETGNAPFSNDELLRRAIGSSIFECLQPKNIIFEGWLDKELFNKYCEFEKVHKDFRNYGKVYLGGISGAETLVQLLVLASKKFVIVADSDETSNNKKVEFFKNYPEYKDSWLSYDDILKNISTMEDFIDDKHIEEQINKCGYNGYKYDDSKNAIQNIDKAVNKDKEKKQEVKNTIISAITKDKIKKDYAEYVGKLKEKLEHL
jgi:predicted ATPase